MPQVDEILALLKGHRLIQNARVVNFDQTPFGRLELKIRCRLKRTGYQLQVWLHVEPGSLDYAYQLFTDAPLLRWDNAPHFPDISTTPHHFHDASGHVGESPLSGDVLVDLAVVLAEIEQWLNRQL